MVFSISGYSLAQNSDKLLAQSKDLKEDNRLDEALVKIDKVLSKVENIDAYFLKAEILFDMKKYQIVYDTYNEVVELDPTNSIALTKRGLFLVKLNEHAAAEKDLNDAMEYANTDSLKCYVYANAGAVFGYLGQHEKSFDYLRKAVECDSTNLDVLVSLGATCDALGKTDLALNYLNKALSLDSTNFMIYGNIGFILQGQEKYAEAVSSFEKALELKPEEPQTMGNLAFNQYKLGKLDAAIENINKSIKLYPQNSYSYRTRAMIYLKKGENEKACEEIQISIEKGYTKLHGDGAVEFQRNNCNK